MVTTSRDISIVLSGGSTNTSPDDSIGGLPSNTPITSNVINNLFTDALAEEQVNGLEDHRCFYIFNDGSTPIYTINLWISEEVISGASVEMGIKSVNEIQRLSISPIPTSGSLRLSFEGIEFVLNTNLDIGLMANEFKAKLNSLTNEDGYSALKNVVVTGQTLSNQIVFDINFAGSSGGFGQDDKKNHEILTYISNTFPVTTEVVITVLQEGSPINSVAETLTSALSVPSNVGFYKPTENSPIVIPRLLPSEGFPVWVKRYITSEAEPTENDGFTFRFTSNSLNPF